MATPYTVKEKDWISLYDILDGNTPQDVIKEIEFISNNAPDGVFSVESSWDSTELYYEWIRPMTDKEIEKERKRRKKQKEAENVKKLKKEEQERKQLEKLKKKYEG
jgi:hypothetical protein